MFASSLMRVNLAKDLNKRQNSGSASNQVIQIDTTMQGAQICKEIEESKEEPNQTVRLGRR